MAYLITVDKWDTIIANYYGTNHEGYKYAESKPNKDS